MGHPVYLRRAGRGCHHGRVRGLPLHRQPRRLRACCAQLCHVPHQIYQGRHFRRGSISIAPHSLTSAFTF